MLAKMKHGNYCTQGERVINQHNTVNTKISPKRAAEILVGSTKSSITEQLQIGRTHKTQ